MIYTPFYGGFLRSSIYNGIFSLVEFFCFKWKIFNDVYPILRLKNVHFTIYNRDINKFEKNVYT